MKYFYSDGIWDIKRGMYCVTDKGMVLYSSSREAPKAKIDFEDVYKIEVEYNPSHFEDSYLTVYSEEKVELIPLSSEKGRDWECIEYILSKIPEMPDQEPREEYIQRIFNKNPLSPRSDPNEDQEE